MVLVCGKVCGKIGGKKITGIPDSRTRGPSVVGVKKIQQQKNTGLPDSRKRGSVAPAVLVVPIILK